MTMDSSTLISPVRAGRVETGRVAMRARPHSSDPLAGPRPSRPAASSDAPSIVRRHQQALWRYLRHLGCDREAAADLAQDAFVVLLRTRPVPAESAQLAFLRGTARNLWRNWLRARRRRPELRGWADAVDHLWAAAPAPDVRLDRLHGCLEELGPRARRSVALFYEQGMSRSGVAAQLELSVDGVKSLLRRTRRALAECISTVSGGER